VFKTHARLLSLTLALGAAVPAFAKPAILQGDNPLWHTPASGQSATWVGDDQQTEPSITLDKKSIQRMLTQIRIQTDARMIRISSGPRVTELAIEPDQTHLLTLDGQEEMPSISLNRHEQFRNRGGWIGILWRSQEEGITVTFVGATYVNLAFPSAGSASTASISTPASVVALPANAPAPFVATTAPVAQSDMQTEAPSTGQPIHPAQPNVNPITTSADTGPIIANSTSVPDVGPARQYAPAPGYYPSLIEPENAARFSIDAGVDFLSGYFYRGMGRSQGRLVIQPWVDADLRIYGGPDHKNEILNGVHLTFGARTSHLFGDPRLKQDQDERWFDLQWRGGVEMHVFDRWRVGLEYENIENIRSSWRDVHQFNAYAKFDDSDPNYSWSLQPHILFSYEYEKQSDAGFLSRALYEDKRFKSGIYMQAGIRPEFEVFKISGKPAKLALPVTIGLSLDDYFQDTDADDSFFGYVDVGANLNIPLWSMPTDSGSRQLEWSLDLGVNALILGSSIRDINETVGVGDHDVQVIGKIGLKFNY